MAITISDPVLVGYAVRASDSALIVTFQHAILKDGQQTSAYSDTVTHLPGSDVSALGDQIKAVAAALWTPEFLAAREAARIKPFNDALVDLQKQINVKIANGQDTGAAMLQKQVADLTAQRDSGAEYQVT